LLRAERYGVGGLLDRIVGTFGRANTYVELQRHLHRDQEDDNDALVCLAEAFRVPLVATGGVSFATPEERPLFDVLTSIREHVPLHRAGRRLAANAERYLKPPAQMARLFADLPQAVHATRDLADRLQFTMTDLGYRFPRYPVPDGETEISFLRKIAEVGARDRYRPYYDKARAQVARELDLIEKLQLAGYFLIAVQMPLELDISVGAAKGADNAIEQAANTVALGAQQRAPRHGNQSGGEAVEFVEGQRALALRRAQLHARQQATQVAPAFLGRDEDGKGEQ